MKRKKPIKMGTLKKQVPPTEKDYDYPDKTTGSEAVAKARKDANRWTDSRRSQLFETGMQIIYGGTGSKAPIRTGH